MNIKNRDIVISKLESALYNLRMANEMNILNGERDICARYDRESINYINDALEIMGYEVKPL